MTMAIELSEGAKRMFVHYLTEQCDSCLLARMDCRCDFMTEQEQADVYYEQMKTRLDERSPA